MNTKVHFADTSLIAPTNPVAVNLIGAGGTGSKVLTALMEMNHSLLELGHPGLSVRLWDDDAITHANLGRQRFAQSEVGLNKAVALINRANRWMGTNWKAKPQKFGWDISGKIPQDAQAVIYISCVDTVSARFAIAEILDSLANKRASANRPRYWLDFGNSHHTGQVILSTIGQIDQPASTKYQTVAVLPQITQEFGELLTKSETTDDTPSCSLAQALEKQDLYINSVLAAMGCSLLWNLFRYGFTAKRGFFLNLGDFHAQPLKVG